MPDISRFSRAGHVRIWRIIQLIIIKSYAVWQLDGPDCQDFLVVNKDGVGELNIFRITQLEDIHAKCEEFTDTDMRNLMIECCERVEGLLNKLTEDPAYFIATLDDFQKDYCGKWEK